MRYLLSTMAIVVFTSFGIPGKNTDLSMPPVANPDTTDLTVAETGSGIDPDALVNFAKTLQGVPYTWGSTDPKKGFDCSGFVSYVTSHFGLDVPRSSVQFTNFGTEVKRTEARPGDIILFTGTDAGSRIVGHMGIITQIQSDGLSFIHSTSGKAKGVTISPFEGYYETRFVKIIRII